ncbi:MAG: beta-galactosidase [Anaerolineae bacterium]
MSETGHTYPYGASYSPLIYPEATWAQDLCRMQAAGMNLVRIGDVHGSWDRIEPQEGELRLDLLERFYRAAADHGIRVLLSNGTACPPLWLARKYPDVRLLSSRGERYPLAASYHWACIHHPGFLDEARRYTTALAKFAATQPNHFGWQISNEMGFPFMPARGQDELDLYCYCKHCKARFRQWVQAKYETLEALTHAWTWSTTAFHYNAWEEVEPPEALPYAWSGVTRWIDWRLFWQEAFADFAGWQHALLKRYDPAHPTSVNTFNFKGHDRFGTFMGLDQWKIAQRVDHVGYDLYPGSGDKLKTRPEHNSIFLDHGRSVSRAAGTDFWLHEMESGPINGWLLGPDHNTRPEEILRNGLEALGHDVKLGLFMPWREWPYQPIRWGALVELDGEPTPRYTAAAEFGRFLQTHADFLLEAHVPQGEVAILETKPNAIFLRGLHQERVLFQAQRGAYRAFWELGYRVDFVTPMQVLAGATAGYKALALPLVGLLDMETAGALREYVADGGLLVGFARCATLDQRGWYHHPLPIPPLQDTFGLRAVTADDRADEPVTFAGQTYAGHLKRDVVQPAAETEVLGTFPDGRPAVTLAHHGAGHGLYFATQADAGYVETERPLLRPVLESVLRRLEIGPELRLLYAGERRALDPHLLRRGRRDMIFVANYLPGRITATLEMTARGERAEIRQLWPTQASLAGAVEETKLHLELIFKQKGGVFEIVWYT